MNRKESEFLAKKLFVELVYNCAYMEGVDMTFPQTQTLLNGGTIRAKGTDLTTVLNLRDGLKWVLSTLDEPLTLEYLCKINEFVARNESLDWGVLRTGGVYVSGTKYIPPTPQKTDIVQWLLAGVDTLDIVERALDYFCGIVRRQLFWDGNKRTATLTANKILIANGCGVLTIDAEHSERFNTALLHYYNTEDDQGLKIVLRECIKTLDTLNTSDGSTELFNKAIPYKGDYK